MILADEPTGALDAETAEALTATLLSASVAQGAAMVVVTHSERLAGAMQRRLHLRDGKLHAAGEA